MKIVALFALVFLIPSLIAAQEFNTVLMQSTFKIIGIKKLPAGTKPEVGKTEFTFGTAFVVGKPTKARLEYRLMF